MTRVSHASRKAAKLTLNQARKAARVVRNERGGAWVVVTGRDGGALRDKYLGQIGHSAGGRSRKKAAKKK